MAEEKVYEVQVIVKDHTDASATSHAEYETGESDPAKVAEQLTDTLKSRFGKNWRPIDSEQ
jgi:hypothetical protein